MASSNNNNAQQGSGKSRLSEDDTSGSKGENSTENKKSLRKHKNPIVRIFANAGYGVWLVILGIGGILAFIATVVAL